MAENEKIRPAEEKLILLNPHLAGAWFFILKHSFIDRPLQSLYFVIQYQIFHQMFQFETERLYYSHLKFISSLFSVDCIL